eukprot:gb/GEZN01007027.1/.p1 GENE.gb/GEZN01007027.1/~~gb/GEZN01007027.1/.p1  ORF type:complete len:427 (-),score=15.16 gb/GEZN01007027.1/:247-1527(-)
MDLALLLGVISCMSMFCSLCIILIFIVFQRVRSSSYKRVLFMSLCDLGLSFQFTVVFWNPSRPLTMTHNPVLCNISAIAQNFFVVATVSWYMMIALSVFAIFANATQVRISTFSLDRCQHFYVWPVSIFCSWLPWYTGDYESVDNDTNCWISESGDLIKLTLLLPILLSLVASLFIVIKVGLLMSSAAANSNGAASSEALASFRFRMLFFVGMFTFCWIWPAISNTWDIINPGGVPTSLHIVSLCVMCGCGIFNFIVWVGVPMVTKLISRYQWRRALQIQGRVHVKDRTASDSNAIPFLGGMDSRIQYPASYFGNQVGEAPVDILQELYDDQTAERQFENVSPREPGGSPCSLGLVHTEMTSRTDDQLSWVNATTAYAAERFIEDSQGQRGDAFNLEDVEDAMGGVEDPMGDQDMEDTIIAAESYR